MASVPMGARAYFRGDEDVRAEAPLRTFVAELTRLGYYLMDHDEEMGQVAAILQAMDPGEPRPNPGPSPTLLASLADYVAGRRMGRKLRSQLFFPSCELYVGVYATEVDPTLGHTFFKLACSPQAGAISLETESKKFDNDLVHPRWMALTQAMYDAWRPLYLFPYYDVGENSSSRDELLAGGVTYLHTEYNYFGPAVVARLGRERLLQTPGWLSLSRWMGEYLSDRATPRRRRPISVSRSRLTSSSRSSAAAGVARCAEGSPWALASLRRGACDESLL